MSPRILTNIASVLRNSRIMYMNMGDVAREARISRSSAHRFFNEIEKRKMPSFIEMKAGIFSRVEEYRFENGEKVIRLTREDFFRADIDDMYCGVLFLGGEKWITLQ